MMGRVNTRHIPSEPAAVEGRYEPVWKNIPESPTEIFRE
jgi:hypothetical protein